MTIHWENQLWNHEIFRAGLPHPAHGAGGVCARKDVFVHEEPPYLWHQQPIIEGHSADVVDPMLRAPKQPLFRYIDPISQKPTGDLQNYCFCDCRTTNQKECEHWWASIDLESDADKSSSSARSSWLVIGTYLWTTKVTGDHHPMFVAKNHPELFVKPLTKQPCHQAIPVRFPVDWEIPTRSS